MYQGRRVVSVTPYGRHRYVEILARYLLSLRPLIDEHHFWVNTDDADDLAFVEGLAAAVSDLASLRHLRIVGLMAIPPFDVDPERSRPWFQRLAALRD